MTIQNLNNNTITVMGHGGMGIWDAYPINTFESVKKCLGSGAAGSELDLQLTKDGVLVLYHNHYLEQATHGKGLIINQNWDNIKDTRYKNPPYGSFKIISLNELLAGLEQPSQYIFTLDCKLYHDNLNPYDYFEKFALSLKEITNKYGMAHKFNIESDNVIFLNGLKDSAKTYKLFIYADNMTRDLQTAIDNELTGISIDQGKANKTDIDNAHKQGKMVALWNTQTNNENKSAIGKNPDFIQTDRLKHLMRCLK